MQKEAAQGDMASMGLLSLTRVKLSVATCQVEF